MTFYENIVRQYYNEILNFCTYRANGNREIARECTQEVFLALYRKMHKFRMDDNIRAWLYEAARREVLNYMSKNRNTMVSLEDMPEIEDKSADFSAMNESCLDSLDDDERAVIEEYYNSDDKSEIALKLGLSKNGLYIKIHRIRKKLLAMKENK